MELFDLIHRLNLKLGLSFLYQVLLLKEVLFPQTFVDESDLGLDHMPDGEEEEEEEEERWEGWFRRKQESITRH